KRVEGLETMSYQASIFDSIPYKLQAEQLVKYVKDENDSKEKADKQFEEMTEAYKSQDIEKLGEFINEDEGLGGYGDILLYNRNRNWVKKLKVIMPDKSVVIAVGAGHLAGEKGVI